MSNVTSFGVECQENVNSVSFHSYKNNDTTFLSLTDVRIEGCQSLSNVEQFLQPAYVPNIKKIKISSCSNLEHVPTEKFRDFLCLEVLHVSSCPKIKSQCLFAPSLQELYLANSGDLIYNIECSSLTKFHLLDYPIESMELKMWNLPSLQKLEITKCYSLKIIRDSEFLSTDLFHNGARSRMVKFPLLTSLTIKSCKKLEIVDDLLYLPAIESIEIGECKLLSVPTDRLGSFPHLDYLRISFCQRPLNLQSGMLLPPSLHVLMLRSCGESGDLSGWFPCCLENLTNLGVLVIHDCESIVSFPGHMWSSNLKSLRRLIFYKCRNLKSIGAPDKIAHIRFILIDECPELEEFKQPFCGR